MTKAGRLLRRDFHFGIAARCGCMNSFYDTLDVKTKFWPLLLAEYHDCDFPAGKILLVPHVLVSGQQDVKTGLFCSRQQVAIPERIPALLRGSTNPMTFKIRTDRQWGCLIENDSHPKKCKRAAYRDFVQQTR